MALLSLIIEDKPEKRMIYYFVAILAAVVTGLRGNTDEYTRFFSRVSVLSDFLTRIDYSAIEKGYLFAFVCSILKTLGYSVQALFLVIALSSITIHAVYYRKLTQFYIVAFLIYLSHEIYFHEWVGIRMGLASTLVLPSIDFLVKRKNGRFFLLVAVSAS